MAGARNRRRGEVLLMDNECDHECPICFEPLSAPIFLCETGHDICGLCKGKLRVCPQCRAPITNSRNGDLERLIGAAQVQCPNNTAGCVYRMTPASLQRHLQECTFRDYSCPLGQGLGNCPWTGKRSELMNHFKHCHTAHCNIMPNTDIELNYVSMTENNSHMYLASLDKLLFILLLKVDANERMAYWTVQHIGTKKVAEQFNYSIEVTSKYDPCRKVLFTEVCKNDTISSDEVTRQKKCGVISLDALNMYVKNHMLSFRYDITKQFDSSNRFKKNDDSKDTRNSRPHQGPRPGGPRSQSKDSVDPKDTGPTGSEQVKGPGYKGHGYKGRGGHKQNNGGPRSHSKDSADPKNTGPRGSEQAKGPGYKGHGYKGRGGHKQNKA